MALFSKPTARALSILDLLMANPQQAFGLTEMTRRLGLNKATCHAILSTMANYGFLVQDPRNRAYRLGPSIVAAGKAAFAQFPVLEHARPELEKLTTELRTGCGAIGQTAKHIVLLAQYGSSSPLHSPYQHGLRLPNVAPLGACFIAWSPAKQLEAWLAAAQSQLASHDEKLDQRLRLSVIAIRARGFDVTLKTQAEDNLAEGLRKLQDSWSLETLDEIAQRYQRELCREPYHLDRIDPRTHYSVCNISVPVFGNSQQPALNFTVGNIQQDLNGREIIEIAHCLEQAAQRVTLAARNSAPLHEAG